MRLDDALSSLWSRKNVNENHVSVYDKALPDIIDLSFNTQDDGTIGDQFHVVLEDIRRVLSFFTESGLSLNTEKCEVDFINSSLDAKNSMLAKLNVLLPGIKLLDEDSFKLLGAPILEPGLSRSP